MVLGLITELLQQLSTIILLKLLVCQMVSASLELKCMCSITHICRIKDKNFIIFSDSMSSLETFDGFKLELDLVQKIIKDYTHLSNNVGFQVI